MYLLHLILALKLLFAYVNQQINAVFQLPSARAKLCTNKIIQFLTGGVSG